MTTSVQDKDFGAKFLEDIVEHIGENFRPEDVFSQAALSAWAKTQDPDDVCEEGNLHEWARNNDYEKSE